MSDSAAPITLPTLPPPPQRAPIPVLAAVVPIVGSVVLWLVTGSPLTLLFAALGPLVAVASVLDGARTARRHRRRTAREHARDRDRVAGRIAVRHDAERAALRRRHPDVGALLARDGDVWRPVRERGEQLVVGSGDAPSALRVTGGDDADALREAARTVAGAPLTVPVRDGVCVTGPPALAAAVARALVLQLCLGRPPRELSVTAAPVGERSWVDRLPHRGSAGARTVAFTGIGDGDAEADIVIAAVPSGAPTPPRCAAVLEVRGLDDARLAWGSSRVPVSVEGVGLAQAQAIASLLAARAEALAPEPAATPLALAELIAGDRAGPDDRALPVAFGYGPAGAALVDLVADGPHAVVTGVTGTGKSELLVSWILALAARYSTKQVCFLLADFKGGTAFDRLRSLPHVTGVITDLDAGGAVRAIDSLRAEMRRREAALAARGARDIADGGVELARLVIVIDEFAALLADQPELQRVFVDIAARGRALGMHLVLGTQRAGGVIREALMANCPLRISLRTADAADSRFLLGTDAAATLPGGLAGRGRAQLLRAGDPAPTPLTVARGTREDIDDVVGRAGDDPLPQRPWQPPLPRSLTLDEIDMPAGEPAGALRVGLRDEPDRQCQEVQTLRPGRDRGLLVCGGPASGRSNLLSLLAAQHPRPTLIPPDPERAWDVLHAHRPRAGGLLLCDDLDVLLGAYPADYATAVLARLEQLIRTGHAAGEMCVLAAQRLPGALARTADLLPRRLVLPFRSRAEHVAAGGEGTLFDADAPPGRGAWGRTVLQVPQAPRPLAAAVESSAPFAPRPGVTAVVTRRPRRVEDALAAATGSSVLLLSEVSEAIEAPDEVATIIVGDPDQWQRRWSLLAQLREQGDLVISADCAPEFRLLTTSRELPPFALPVPDRAWRCGPEGTIERVILPGESR